MHPGLSDLLHPPDRLRSLAIRIPPCQFFHSSVPKRSNEIVSPHICETLVRRGGIIGLSLVRGLLSRNRLGQKARECALVHRESALLAKAGRAMHPLPVFPEIRQMMFETNEQTARLTDTV